LPIETGIKWWGANPLLREGKKTDDSLALGGGGKKKESTLSLDS